GQPPWVVSGYRAGVVGQPTSAVWGLGAPALDGARPPRAAVSHHSSIRTWALIPPKPKPLTAARRGWPGARASQGSGLVRTRNGLVSSSSLGAGRSKFALGGKTRCFKASRTLSRPAAPAAVSVCPKVPLHD